jgi:hypothetical protein
LETNDVIRGNIKVLGVGLLLAAASIGLQTAAAVEPGKFWDQQPYRIEVTLALDAPGELADRFAAELPAYLERRAVASIGSLWQLHAAIAIGSLQQRALGDIESLTTKDLPKSESDIAGGNDKRILLSVRATPWGYELAGREYDSYVDHWGQTLRASTRQGDSVAEQLFALLARVVTPLAQFHLDPANDRQVILLPRGASLPHVGDFQWAAEGDVFLPIYRRTSREGELVAGGSRVVPWTFLELTKVDPQQATGRIQSGTSRPFAIRQPGRLEQVAIALRADVGDSVVCLRSRTEKDKPLVGYQVFAQNTGEHETQLVGSSDEVGELSVPPGKTTVQLLYIKSGGDLLARVPIVPGAVASIDVPLPDDDLRLQAAARLVALREDLVDLVARRNIFIARVHQQIEDKNYQQARQVLETLDELPTRAQFTQALDREARLHRTKDPQVQREIDKLFAGMQTVVGKFLDSQPIADLHEQLRQTPQKETKGS